MLQLGIVLENKNTRLSKSKNRRGKMEIDVRTLAAEARQMLIEDIKKVDEEERQAYKHEFVQQVIEAAIENRYSVERSCSTHFRVSAKE